MDFWLELTQEIVATTMQAAADAMFNDDDCPPWPLEGMFSIYPREDICRMIINPQTEQICGKRFRGKAAANLQTHVRKIHQYEKKYNGYYTMRH